LPTCETVAIEELLLLKLYHAPRTRSVRIRWLLEELGIQHELERVEFRRPAFQRATAD